MILEKLLKLFKIRFEGELLLKDGTPIVIGGDFGIGVTVQVNGPDGLIPLPTGSYELEDGTIFTVDNTGVITDIVEQVETPETPDVTPPVEAVDVPIEDTPIEDTTIPETPVNPMDEMMKKMEEKIAELEAKIKELEAKTTNLSKEGIKFENELSDFKTKAIFVKEISKQKQEDSIPSELNGKIDLINKFKSIKK